MQIKHDPLSNYKPDVISCLADLSNDEVFTPPEVANKMLDLLPKDLFSNPETKFLDPSCKSGVFLREIASRLIKGLENKIPDLQERCDWIFKNQLYGIAITELTSLLSRRTVYCAKYPNSLFSITRFDNVQGNILYQKIKHEWDKENDSGHCVFCGTSYKGELNEIAREGLESHAYEFVHTLEPEKIFNMKFDVIISNPPYQLNDGGNGSSAKPIYNLFVEQAKRLNPRYLLMIIPSRWFNGGKGLDDFRKSMFSDSRLTHLVDYQNAKICFPGVSLGGGVCYFLWERDRKANCQITNILNKRSITLTRPLNQFPVFIRYNDAIGIINKINSKAESSMADYISSRNPFGLSTKERGDEKKISNSVMLFSSGGVGYIKRNLISQGIECIDSYKVMISRITSEHAGEPDKDGKYKIIARIKILKPGEVCTDSYVITGISNDETFTTNCFEYLKTKFVRFLILQSLSSINLSKESYRFVPIQDFSKRWSDQELFHKYDLSNEEIDLITNQIKDMD